VILNVSPEIGCNWRKAHKENHQLEAAAGGFWVAGATAPALASFKASKGEEVINSYQVSLLWEV
jgi:hypothetical protein